MGIHVGVGAGAGLLVAALAAEAVPLASEVLG